MMKARIVWLISIGLLVIMLSPVLCTGDTGTYEIEDYTVTLAPRKNGQVEITYYQKWKVTGGNISWITVGMANSDFTLVHERTGGNISDIKNRNHGSWSGVYIVLDNKYLPEETFEAEFAVLQNGLFYFYKDGRKYLLHYIPGWYKHGRINHLAIELNFFTELDGVSSKPKPDLAGSKSLSWERNSLKKGSKFTVSVLFPKELFPEKVHLNSNKKFSSPNKKDKEINAAVGGIIGIFVVLIAVAIVIVIFARASNKAYGSGGKIGTGGRTGIRGTGCVVTCACACAGCACACACAGGGAAGCDRKLTFNCPLCKECDNEDCPIRSEQV